MATSTTQLKMEREPIYGRRANHSGVAKDGCPFRQHGFASKVSGNDLTLFWIAVPQ